MSIKKLDKRGLALKYNAVIKRIDKRTQKILEQERIHNLVVNDGLELVAKLLGGGVSDPLNSIAIGEGQVAVQATDTALGSEVTRATATVTYPTTSQVEYEKLFTFGSGEAYDITEAGLFDSVTPSGSTMFNRLVFSNKSVDADTDLSITITITVSRV